MRLKEETEFREQTPPKAKKGGDPPAAGEMEGYKIRLKQTLDHG
jgi:hypothetical protein